MSRSRKGSKGPGAEYWSRRCPDYFLDPGEASKKRTRKYERNLSKEELRKLEQGLDDARNGRFVDGPDVEDD